MWHIHVPEHANFVTDTTPAVLALMVLVCFLHVFIIRKVRVVFKIRSSLKCLLEAYREAFHIRVKCMFIWKTLSTTTLTGTGRAPTAYFLPCNVCYTPPSAQSTGSVCAWTSVRECVRACVLGEQLSCQDQSLSLKSCTICKKCNRKNKKHCI